MDNSGFVIYCVDPRLNLKRFTQTNRPTQNFYRICQRYLRNRLRRFPLSKFSLIFGRSFSGPGLLALNFSKFVRNCQVKISYFSRGTANDFHVESRTLCLFPRTDFSTSKGFQSFSRHRVDLKLNSKKVFFFFFLGKQTFNQFYFFFFFFNSEFPFKHSRRRLDNFYRSYLSNNTNPRPKKLCKYLQSTRFPKKIFFFYRRHR